MSEKYFDVWNVPTNRPIIYTNGCFDLLHTGHTRYLNEVKAIALQHGGKVVIGLNTDESIQRLKGSSRPILPYEQRIELLHALRSVDIVVPIHEQTIEAHLSVLKPVVWCKGGDYTLETLNASEVAMAKEVGAEIRLIKLEVGISTSSIVGKIVNSWLAETLNERLAV